MAENTGEVPPTRTAAPPLSEAVQQAPDPDEDDLDDLDDMLDEFSTTKIDEKKDAPTASGPGRPDTQNLISLPDDAIPDDFSKQLQSEMAALMGGMEETPEMQQQIEAMMKELGTVVDPLSHLGQQAADKTNETASNQGPSSTEEESFQETIRKTMERMQASGERATAAATSDNSDDILAQMLKNMQGGDSEGAGGEEDFSKMLMGMMEQLTNRAILYEPMKELHDKFPGWMSKNKESTKPEDLHRYEEQQSLVAQIVGRFERKEYSDDNAVDREFIVERMQKMQAAGSPPADLVGDMNAAQEVLGDLDPACPQQ